MTWGRFRSAFRGSHRIARIQRFEARNSPRAKIIKKKARKAARKARKR